MFDRARFFGKITNILVALSVLVSLSARTFTAAEISNRTSVRSTGTLLNIIIGGRSVLPKRHRPIRITQSPRRPTSPPTTAPPRNPIQNNPFASFGTSLTFFSPVSSGGSSNALRTFLFDPLMGNMESIQLAGSYLPYMGRVQVALPEKQWGSICGEGWDVNDATVVCRQLGFAIGGVIARPRMEFGHAIGPVVMSRVNCRGDETSIQECSAVRWDGRNSLPCRRGLSAAGLVCGCPLNVSERVRSRCFLFTSFPYDSLYCHHSCPPNQVLVGDRRRHCGRQQSWTGIQPRCIEIAPVNPRPLCRIPTGNRMPCLRQNHMDIPLLQRASDRVDPSDAENCISYGCCYDHTKRVASNRCFLPADSPCVGEPCDNDGVCQDFFRESSRYECTCPAPYGGMNCEFRRDWQCGRSIFQPNLDHVRPQLRIVGGRVVERGSWPWVVQFRDNNSHFCSGTLIAPQWVITAAHCLQLRNIANGPNNSTRWSIIAGQHSQLGHDATSQSLSIVYAISNNFTNTDIPRKDIALLKLSRPITVDNYTSPICLPGRRTEGPATGSKCWIAGWGKTRLSGLIPQYMQQGDIPILSTETCRTNNYYPDRDYRLVGENMICAGYEMGGVDACKGDSGGPLMCPRADGTWYLAGIVSWGYGCADPFTPGVYTRVSHYLDWVYDIIQRF